MPSAVARESFSRVGEGAASSTPQQRSAQIPRPHRAPMAIHHPEGSGEVSSLCASCWHGAAQGPRVVLNISAESLSPRASRAALVKKIRNTENPCRNHGNTVLLKQCSLVRLRFITSRGDRGGCVGERARAFGFAFLCPRSNQMQENCVNESL